MKKTRKILLTVGVLIMCILILLNLRVIFDSEYLNWKKQYGEKKSQRLYLSEEYLSKVIFEPKEKVYPSPPNKQSQEMKECIREEMIEGPYFPDGIRGKVTLSLSATESAVKEINEIFSQLGFKQKIPNDIDHETVWTVHTRAQESIPVSRLKEITKDIEERYSDLIYTAKSANSYHGIYISAKNIPKDDFVLLIKQYRELEITEMLSFEESSYDFDLNVNEGEELQWICSFYKLIPRDYFWYIQQPIDIQLG